MSLRLGGGRVPERPLGVILRYRIELDKHHAAAWLVFAACKKSLSIDDLAENRAASPLLGGDVREVDLDVLGGQGLSESLFGLLVPSSNSFPLHPEKE